tara:strand:+ start:3470 stop:3946 length:477 start_codon:yes stop_codon:yes gene_type:complete
MFNNFNDAYICHVKQENELYKKESKYNLANYFNLKNEYNSVPSLATKYNTEIFKRGVIPPNFDVKTPIEKGTEFYKYKNEIPIENKLWYHDILAKKDAKSFIPESNSDMYKVNIKNDNYIIPNKLLFDYPKLSNSNVPPVPKNTFNFYNSTRQERNQI